MDLNTRKFEQELGRLYQAESRRVLATLIRLLGDFDLAEEALHEAFAAALKQWPAEGVPENPRAWLVSAGRFKAIDQLRKRARSDGSQEELARRLDEQAAENELALDEDIEDDRLRLVFTCCHPSLASDTQVALTLREICDLTTEEIASAYLAKPATIAQRIVRAKNKIRDAKIPYEVPTGAELPERLDSVLQVVYLVFNEGYSASTGAKVTRHDLSAEAIRLGRLVLELLPEPEVMGLLALMLLHESRREARTNAEGDLILLDEQDRGIWDKNLIREGSDLVRQSLLTGSVGPYTIQAAIVAVHASAGSAQDTDWDEIVGLYNLLMRIQASPVIELNRAVAVAMLSGAEVGLEIIEAILARGDLTDYHLAHSARADLLRRLERKDEAARAYRQALALSKQEPEQRFLRRRLDSLEN